MIRKTVLPLLLINIVGEIQSARILGVFNFPSISHQAVFSKITHELWNRGHDLTVVTTDPEYPKGKAPANFTEIDIHDITYAAKNDFYTNSGMMGNNDVVYVTKIAKQLLAHLFEAQLNEPEVKDLLFNRQNKFDLILIEAMVRPAYVISYIFKVPLILISSLGVTFNDNNVFGCPSHPVLYPSVLNKRIYNLTVWERLKIFYDYFMVEYGDIELQDAEHKMLQKYFGSDVPTITELYNNVDMIFLNVHSIWADNAPVPPNVIYLGGMSLKDEKTLPQDLKTYIETSKNGVIYVSFGSNLLARHIPSNVIESIVKVLSGMPYNILWKWDEKQLPLNPKNILIKEWFPQQDILRHKNVKLFITQAGMQSTDEAIMAGIPLVAVPLLADQQFNAEKYVHHRIGKKVSIEDFDENMFKESVESVLNDKSYQHNVAKLRKLISDQPEPPLERVMWWTEYVLRNGGAKHLRAPAANMSWMQYIEIEVIVIIITISLVSITVMILVLLICYNFISSKFSKKIQANKNNNFKKHN